MVLEAALLLVEVKYTNYIDLLPEKCHLNVSEAFIDKRLRLVQTIVRSEQLNHNQHRIQIAGA